VASAAQAGSSATAARAQLGRLAGNIVTAASKNPSFRLAAASDPVGAPAAQALETANAASSAAVTATARAVGGAPEGLTAAQLRELTNAVYFDELSRRGVELAIVAGSGNATPQLSLPRAQNGTAYVSDGVNVYEQPSTVVNIGLGMTTLRVGDAILTPGGGYAVIRSGGYAAGQTRPVALDVSARSFDVANLVQAPVVGTSGGPSKLIGADGGTLVASGRLNTVATGGAGLVAAGGGNLVGPDGGSLVGPDGGSLVAAGGLNLVAAGAGNLIGADGGSLVGPDGGSLVGPDGASLVGPDGGSR
jgi:hypothetical protein